MHCRTWVVAAAIVCMASAFDVLAEDAVRFIDSHRTAVYRSHLIVRGTLRDVRRRDLLVRGWHPEFRHLRKEWYFDTGNIAVEEVLWSDDEIRWIGTSSNLVPTAMPSWTDRFPRDPRTHPDRRNQPPIYSDGDHGIWMLGHEQDYWGYRVVRQWPEYMIRDGDPAVEKVLRIIDERRAGKPLHE